MSLSDLAAIGSFVSGVAVLISLIYLGLQVRHAERNQRAQMHQARIDRVANISIAFSQPAMAAVLAKSTLASPDLSSEEVVQLFYFLRTQVVSLDDALWQHDAGLLDETSLQTTILTSQRLSRIRRSGRCGRCCGCGSRPISRSG